MEFLLISEAVACLEAGMYGGGFSRPEPVEAAKKIYPRASIGWSVQKQKAAVTIDAAILNGDLPVYVIARRTAQDAYGPVVVPIDVLQRMPRTRGGLPDHPVRPPATFLHNFPIARALFTALSVSALHLSRSEFAAWYEREKHKRRWPSQADSDAARIGRPSKQTDELFTSIKALTNGGLWSASDGIEKLVRLLASNGAPNRFLVRRAVQRLFEETGDPRYRIVPRKRAKEKPGTFQT
jgi:hypothetical protein